MRWRGTLWVAMLAFGLMAGVAPLSYAQGIPGLDTAGIDAASGLKGQFISEENVFKIGKPRSDVKIQVDQWAMAPFMGLGSWAAFTPGHGGAMMMGDTVVFEDEVNPVMSAAFEAGLDVTALHNHFFFDEPKVYFMHIGGEGPLDQLAGAVRKVYDKIKEIRAANPHPRDTFGAGSLPDQNAITPGPLNEIFGLSGDV